MAKPLAMMVTRVTRLPAGAISATMAMVMGTTAPSPHPAINRQMATSVGPLLCMAASVPSPSSMQADDQHGAATEPVGQRTQAHGTQCHPGQ